jgi:hypothetical protein
MTMMQIFKRTVRSYTQPEVLSWFEEHEDALQHLPWLAESPDLNTIQPLLSVLESRVRSRFSAPQSFEQLEDLMFF